jgi:hypothetical protein
MAEWYVISPGGEPVGPVSEELVIKGVLGGKVPVEALVARVGEGDWLPLVSVPVFAQAIRQIAPPIPPPPPPPTEQEGAWYASVQGEILGPFAQSEIINSIFNGKFPTNVLVCRVGQSSWKSLEDEPVFKHLSKKSQPTTINTTAQLHVPHPSGEVAPGWHPSAPPQSTPESPASKHTTDPYGLALVLLPAAVGLLNFVFPAEMLGGMMVVVVILSTIAVSLDRNRWNLPGTHAVATFLMWIFATPHYLHLRAKNGAPRLLWKWIAAVSFCFSTLFISAVLKDAEIPLCALLQGDLAE